MRRMKDVLFGALRVDERHKLLAGLDHDQQCS
jgi:hypothetical protein